MPLRTLFFLCKELSYKVVKHPHSGSANFMEMKFGGGRGGAEKLVLNLYAPAMQTQSQKNQEGH